MQASCQPGPLSSEGSAGVGEATSKFTHEAEGRKRRTLLAAGWRLHSLTQGPLRGLSVLMTWQLVTSEHLVTLRESTGQAFSHLLDSDAMPSLLLCAIHHTDRWAGWAAPGMNTRSWGLRATLESAATLARSRPSRKCCCCGCPCGPLGAVRWGAGLEARAPVSTPGSGPCRRAWAGSGGRRTGPASVPEGVD